MRVNLDIATLLVRKAQYFGWRDGTLHLEYISKSTDEDYRKLKNA